MAHGPITESSGVMAPTHCNGRFGINPASVLAVPTKIGNTNDYMTALCTLQKDMKRVSIAKVPSHDMLNK